VEGCRADRDPAKGDTDPAKESADLNPGGRRRPQTGGEDDLSFRAVGESGEGGRGLADFGTARRPPPQPPPAGGGGGHREAYGGEEVVSPSRPRVARERRRGGSKVCAQLLLYTPKYALLSRYSLHSGM